MATSLATVMEGARQGGDVFQALCAQVLGPGWTEYQGGGAVPGELVAQQTDAEHFVDCEPDVFRIIINYLRDGAVPSAELHLLSNVRAYAAKIGMQELAHQVALRHSRQQVMKLLNSQQRNLSDGSERNGPLRYRLQRRKLVPHTSLQRAPTRGRLLRSKSVRSRSDGRNLF